MGKMYAREKGVGEMFAGRAANSCRARNGWRETLTITPEGTGGGGGKAREFLRRERNFSQGVRGRCDRP
jgi:hypothetical protein